jgi:hypothetical protein
MASDDHRAVKACFKNEEKSGFNEIWPVFGAQVAKNP